MFIRVHDDRYVPLGDTLLRARDWVESGHPLGFPTAEDLAYHLTTLFPPVRPKGWLELRMIDALPDPWWRVPVAVAAAWIDDASVVEAASPSAGRWLEAARCGLTDPMLGPLAAWAAGRAVASLEDVGADPCTAALTEQWASCVQDGRRLPWM
jgi:glutamate--cysteine ligase